MDKERTLHVALIGLGARGLNGTAHSIHAIDSVEISAICDSNQERLDKGMALMQEFGYDCTPYTDYRYILDRPDIDAVIVSTSWLSHIPIACDCMRAGKYVGFEVGGAFSLAQCRKLVDVYEETGVPCMMLENISYGRPELAVFNMVRKGLFGELIHAEGGYCHFFETRMVSKLHENGYRAPHYLHRNCDNYPCHGLALPFMALDINRGNRFVSLVSVATKTLGLRNETERVFGANSPESRLDWQLGDVITTILKTAHGQTVTLTLDDQLPRPYSRRGMIQGTGGIYMEDGHQIYIDGRSPFNENRGHPIWEPAESYLKEFDHPLWKEREAQGKTAGGHGGTDSIVIEAFLEAVRNGTNTPLDAYDTATYMAISALSEQSIAEGGSMVFFPDFTDGKWIVRGRDYKSKYSLDDVYDDLF